MLEKRARQAMPNAIKEENLVMIEVNKEMNRMDDLPEQCLYILKMILVTPYVLLCSLYMHNGTMYVVPGEPSTPSA